MKGHAKRNSTRAIALLLVMGLLVPAVALAETPGVAAYGSEAHAGETKTGVKTAQPETSASGETPLRLSEQRKEQIRSRVQDRLRLRALRFDRASGVLTDRLDRLEDLAMVIGDAGGDVAVALELIAEARALVQEAATLDEAARALFEAIADSDDPRAAFEEARDTARDASKALRDARAKAREAALTLREIVVSMQEGE